MVENGYRQLSERQGDASVSEQERRKVLLDATKQVGPAIFFSLLLIVVSFLPVLLLEAQEGRRGGGGKRLRSRRLTIFQAQAALRKVRGGMV